MRQTKPCGRDIVINGITLTCTYPRKRTKTACVWHWLLRQPIETQIRIASTRRANPHFDIERPRVPEREWPQGERWCAGCQNFIPTWYTIGSRCRACSSQASHASHVQRVYDLDPQDYQRLLDWQGGRCYVCGQVPRVRRLAVDHDHATGEVRGLLCSNDEWGCNVMLSRVLNDPECAVRLLEYVERYPIQRMRAGEEPRRWPRKVNEIVESLKALEPWDPFGTGSDGR